jgi:hypothetical protein
MELVATSLQLSQAEINRLKIENPTSMSDVIQGIFVTWKHKRGPAATLENLEKALKATEEDTGAILNWIVFSQAKKRILNKNTLNP